MVRCGPGLRPPKPTPHGPPTGSGGREKWFIVGRKKWEPERLLSAFSQRVPTYVPSPPSRWAGRYGPFAVRAAGRVSCKKYGFPPHNPTREGSPEGRTSSLWGSFPHFFPRNGAPAGQARVPARSNGVRKKPKCSGRQRRYPYAPRRHLRRPGRYEQAADAGHAVNKDRPGAVVRALQTVAMMKPPV